MATNNTTALPLIEPFSIPDVFCLTLAKIERGGPLVRLVFATPQSPNFGEGDGPAENAVVARLLVPAEALASIADRLLGEPRTLRADPPQPKRELN